MFKRGGIYSVKLMHHEHCETYLCPSLVISNNISNEFSPVVTILPLSTTSLEKIYEFETVLPASCNGLEKDAKVSSHIIITIDKTNIVGDRLGFLPKNILQQVEKSLLLQLGIEETPGVLRG